VRISGIAYRLSMFPLAGSLFILLFLLPVPVFAQGPVDLTFEETGVFPLSITGILPGDHGSTFVDFTIMEPRMGLSIFGLITSA